MGFKILKGLDRVLQVFSQCHLHVMLQAASDNQQTRRRGPSNDQHQRG
jgi:hypothetical protein